MLRKILLFIGLSVTIAMLAVPARKDVRTFVQPDGKVIHLSLFGDEHMHTYVTSDGLAVGVDDNGCYKYLVAGGITDVMVSDPKQRDASEKAFVAENASRLDVNNVLASRQKNINRAPMRIGQPEIPTTGAPRVPVLLVGYRDYDFRDGDEAIDTFNSFFKDGEKSALQYFTDQSNGQYTPQFDLYGPYKLPHERSYYGKNGWNGSDQYVGLMVADGITGLDEIIDFSLYDNDGDNECDILIVIYAGDGEASSMHPDARDAIWPCQWTLSASDYGQPVFSDGVKINRFAVFNELYGLDLSKIDGIGCFCHEFSHCLGLPDFYPTQYQSFFGMSNWSIMDYGCYNDDGYTPLGYSAYEKEFNGWMSIPEAEPDTRYTLQPLNQVGESGDMAVRITNDQAPNEYYIIENRQRQGWDYFMPADGLLIYHVTYSERAWIDNTVNNNVMQRMTPIPADNDLKLDYVGGVARANYESLKGDLWPWGDVDALTDTSVPAATVNVGSKMGKPVTEMRRGDDGTISFWFMKAPRPALPTPVIEAIDDVQSDEFTAKWTILDSDVTYTIELRPHREYVYSEIFNNDYLSISDSWQITGFAKVDDDDEALRLGSKSQHGIVTSPAVELEQPCGDFTVLLKARQYADDAQAPLRVSLLDANDAVLMSHTITLDNVMLDYALQFDVAETDAVKVRLETVTRGQRAHISNLALFTGDATCLLPQADVLPATCDKYDRMVGDVRVISGIEGESFKVDKLTAETSYDVRLRVVPRNTDEFSASAWTTPITVTTLAESGIVDVDIDSNVPIEWYDLSGRRLATPAASGIYIMRQGAKITKVLK